jgi:hypothetical protein
VAKYGMFFGWNRPVPGREVEAAEIFNAGMVFWTQKQQEGKIESFEPVLLARHGGDLNGFVLVRGEQEKINAILHSNEFKDLSLRIDHVVLGWGVIPAYVGEGVAEEMGRWQKMIAK